MQPRILLRKRTEIKLILKFVDMYINHFKSLKNFFRFNIDVGVSANIGPEIGVGPKFGVNYEREGREFVVNEVHETLDLGFHNITKVMLGSSRLIFERSLFLDL